MIRLLRHDESVHREEDGGKDNFPGKRREYRRRGFNTAQTLNLPNIFLYFLAIQGHSGGDLVDPTLQDNVLLPDDFAEYIHHIGNAHDMPSIIKSRLIP